MEFPQIKMEFKEIWSGRPYCPYIMALVVEATVRGFKKELPESKIDIGGVYYLNGLHRYFYTKEGYEETVKIIVDKSIKSRDWLYTFFKKAVEKATELRDYTETFMSTNLKEESNQKLLERIDNFSKMFYDMYVYGTILVLLGYNEDNVFYEKMNDALKRGAKGAGKKGEYLVELTKAPKIMIPQEQELALLKIAQKAKLEGIKNIEEIKDKFQEELQGLVERFGWLSYDWCDEPPFDINHFASLVNEKLNFEIEKKIVKIESYEEETNKRVEEISNELSLTTDEKETFGLIRDLGYYKWLREYAFLKASYNIRFVQEELGVRLRLSSKESKYLLPHEYRESFDFPEKIKEKVKQRLKNFLLLISDDEKTVLDDGAKEEYEKLEFEKDEFDSGTKEIIGTPAKSGRVRGIVKIINVVGDMGKMEDKDVLVSQATNPDLMPAMKKAAAIVTNEGGITCHAAIVSRELGIPCVVGTKIATKVLKDGDYVDVDADHGVVKILERK